MFSILINKVNPVGSKGAIVVALAELFAELWSGHYKGQYA